MKREASEVFAEIQAILADLPQPEFKAAEIRHDENSTQKSVMIKLGMGYSLSLAIYDHRKMFETKGAK